MSDFGSDIFKNQKSVIFSPQNLRIKIFLKIKNPLFFALKTRKVNALQTSTTNLHTNFEISSYFSVLHHPIPSE